MQSIENLEQFTSEYQTDLKNVVREYFQHLFLSYLYQQPGSERLLFKGGTALRIVLHSPRFSEDLDFTGSHIAASDVEELFGNALANIEKAAIPVELVEAKPTSGGYLGTAVFRAYDMKTEVFIEVSLRSGKAIDGVRTVIQSDLVPPYSLVHLPINDIIQGKMDALIARHKARDFYDYFFLLSGNYPIVKEKENLMRALSLLRESKIDFRSEVRHLLPASHAMHLRDFKTQLERKILSFLGKE